MISSYGNRVIIEGVSPEIDGGAFPAKRVAGELVRVEADIYADGHDELSALLLHRSPGQRNWRKTPMEHIVNDRWFGVFTAERVGLYTYTMQAWVNHYLTWCRDILKKLEAGQDIGVELEIGLGMLTRAREKAGERDLPKFDLLIAQAREGSDPEKRVELLVGERIRALMDANTPDGTVTTYHRELSLLVERPRALFSTWYEVFPRSCSSEPDTHGTLRDCMKILPDIRSMGFDVVYLPPVHPIGKTHRKGANNSPLAGPEDPGSPWAIGSQEGDHTAVHPNLGTVEDFREFVQTARGLHMEVALDLAFQCSPDHPYVKAHPKWFRWRPDGTVQYAENPPKKYEDILPLNFETEDREGLWEELKQVVLFWIEAGVTIFRVDNPHTKPFVFWEWLIGEVRKVHPDVFFLAEAFTRPKVMYRLAKVGFSQSYTYFTWRNTKHEIVEYLTELTRTEVRNFFRPNFWPNTPDILPEYLQYGGRPAFIIRLVLAATLSSSYGIYGPVFELCVGEALEGREEYRDSEKYEIKHWSREAEGNIREIVTRVNAIRRENPALQETNNVQFFDIENEALLFYAKTDRDRSNMVFVAVNLDPYNIQSGRVRVPLDELHMAHDQPYLLHDQLSDDRYIWQGEYGFVSLNPAVLPVHVFKVHRYRHREQDFDYFM
jgi:starch synthase (maltosyl-transferring)